MQYKKSKTEILKRIYSNLYPKGSLKQNEIIKRLKRARVARDSEGEESPTPNRAPRSSRPRYTRRRTSSRRQQPGVVVVPISPTGLQERNPTLETERGELRGAPIPE